MNEYRVVGTFLNYQTGMGVITGDAHPQHITALNDFEAALEFYSLGLVQVGVGVFIPTKNAITISTTLIGTSDDC